MTEPGAGRFDPELLVSPRRTSWFDRPGGLILILVISLLLALVMVFTYGNLFAVAGIIGIFAVVAFTVYNIDWGFYIFIFFVFLFDQFDIPGFPSVTT